MGFRGESLVGDTFGNLFVSGVAGLNKHGKTLVTVVCSCGREISILATLLTTGRRTCCGCTFTRKRTNFTDITGRRFGRLTVDRLSESRVGKKRSLAWVCTCDCGNVVDGPTTHTLTSGKTGSCGCLQIDRARNTNIGMARNTLPEEELTRRFKEFPVVVEEYCGRVSGRSLVTCKTCGYSWRTSVKCLTSGRGCPSCAKAGYNVSLVGHFYVIRIATITETYLGFGITNRLKRRLAEHQKSFRDHGAIGELIFTHDGHGHDIQAIERTAIEQFEIANTGIPGFIKEATLFADWKVAVLRSLCSEPEQLAISTQTP